MLGRYGVDQLSAALFVVYLLLWVVERIFDLWWMAFLTGAVILVILFRALSRNLEGRRKENQAFLRIWSPVVAWWKNRGLRMEGWRQSRARRKAERAERKKYSYFTCAQCGQKLRVPRGKGKVKVHCPTCGHDFLGRT